jgi:hypothetical protein
MDKDLHNLLLYAKEQGLKIVYKPSKIMCGYAGLHYLVDDNLGLKIPDGEVWIDKNLKSRELFRTLNHELIEIEEMKNGKSYWDAHKFALKHEADDGFLLK